MVRKTVEEGILSKLIHKTDHQLFNNNKVIDQILTVADYFKYLPYDHSK